MNELEQRIEMECRAALATEGVFIHAMDQSRWPLTTGAVVELFRAAGYAITEAELARLIEHGVWSAPEGDCWLAADVLSFGRFLHARRAWHATPNSFHDARKTVWQIRMEQCRGAGDVLAIFDRIGPRIDLRHALVLMTECDSRELREKLLAVVQALLEAEHNVIV